MNEEQQLSLKLAIEGHNIFVSGSAGTGKSYLLSEIARNLRSMGKNVYVTSTTGISCMFFSRSLNPMTVHRWSGIEDGRYTTQEIIDLIKTSPGFNCVLDRILNTEVLLIDEISMLSAKNFNQLAEICQHIKDNGKLFGGIQLIVSGDFYQLPPVPNSLYNDDGEMCFNSNAFKEIVKHKIILKKFVRQSDERLIQAIKKVSSGTLDDELLNYMKELERPLSQSDGTKLFANNFLVDNYNRKKVMEWEGDMYEYKAKDSGERKYMQKLTAPSTIWLKRGVPVILLRNLSNDLVNGLQGTVVGFSEQGPVIEFQGGITRVVEKIIFSVYSPSLRKNLASREQIPLKLAFALTIHKSQGMTLKRVEVDAQQIFKPGQLGVAMGRVRSSECLRVVNFHPRVCMRQPETIDAFLNEESGPVNEDVSCCKVLFRDSTSKIAEDDSFWVEAEPDNENGDCDAFDKDFDEVIANIPLSEETEDFILPENFKTESVLKHLITEPAVTSQQREVNTVVHSILGNMKNIIKYCQKEYLILTRIIAAMNISEPVSVKAENLTEFYAKSHQHLKEVDYKVNCMLGFEGQNLTDAHWHVCYKLFVAIRKHLLSEKAGSFPIADRPISQRQLSDSCKSRIRYVGGYCIKSVRQMHVNRQIATMYSKTSEGITKYDEACERVQILNCLREEEEYIKQTSDDLVSLKDVVRKQNVSRGLTHIPDDLYNFFVAMCETCLKLLVDKNVNSYDASLHEFCIRSILNTESLRDQFLTVVESHFSTIDLAENEGKQTNFSSEITMQIFEDVSRKFMLVMLNQFRKDLLQSFSISKTMAHRKQIQVKKQKSESAKQKITFKYIQNDTSENRGMSHSLMHGLLLGKVDVFSDMTKAEILKLGLAYNLKMQSKTKKSELIQQLTQHILGSNKMIYSSALGEDAHKPYQNVQEAEMTPEPLPTVSGVTTTDTTASGVIEPESSVAESHLNLVGSGIAAQESMSDSELSASANPSTEPMDTDEDSDLCTKCNRTGKPGVQWIQCTSCSSWLHRHCAGLRAKKAWERYSQEGSDFFCNECK